MALIFGGRSAEHAVSCATAAGVMRALDPAVYEVVPIGITREGGWVLGPDDPGALEVAATALPEVVDRPMSVMLPLGDGRRRLIGLQDGRPPADLGEIDVVFPVLHGPYGEDGTVQGLLELTGLPYVGNGVLASAVGMDKHYTKVVLSNHGLPIAPYTVITDSQWRLDREATLRAVAGLGSPFFVKPARGGSSFGVTRVLDLEALPAAIAAAQAFDPKVIVEAAMSGREVECAVLGGRGGNPPRTAELGEVALTNGDFYDFDSKYVDSAGVNLLCPADLPAETASHVRELAVAAFEALAAEGLARVDFFVSADGAVAINEVNTMPGFTPRSMFPLAWERSGLPYSELVHELIQLALERQLGLR